MKIAPGGPRPARLFMKRLMPGLERFPPAHRHQRGEVKRSLIPHHGVYCYFG